MPHPRRLATALVLVLAAGAGCKDEPKHDAPVVAAARSVPVAIFIDDREVATSVELGGEPRPLVELIKDAPAAESWLALEAIDSGGKVHTTMTPAKNQAGKVALLAMGKDGVELGFRAIGAKGGLADPVRAVTKVTIKTRSDAGQIAAQVGEHGSGDSGGKREHADEVRPVASPTMQIAITGARGESVFTGDKLEALPVIKAPAGDTETPGWSLLDVLGAAGIDKPQVVHLTDGEGATLQLGAADFDPAQAVLYLKLNRSGVVRFRVFRKKGETWEVGGELRGITKIHIVK